jgi:MFS family permease
VERHSEKRIWMLSAFGLVTGYMIFFLSKSILVLALGAVFYIASRVLHYESSGIIISHSCSKKQLGKTEGLFYTVTNIGWVIGPLMGGFIAARIGVPLVFVFSAFFVLIGVAMFKNIVLKEYIHCNRTKETLKKTFTHLKDFFSNKKFLLAYFVSGGIALYWGIIYIYGPLYIIWRGLPSYFVGIFLFAVAVPLVLLEYFIGRISDKYGCKKLLILGYIILAFFALLAFLMSNVYLSLWFLILGSIGASLLEATKETYYFKVVKRSEEEKFYGSYRTHQDLFGTIGRFLGAIFLIFFSLQALFLLLAIEMIMFALIATRVKEKQR